MTASQPFFNTNFTLTVTDPTRGRQPEGQGINMLSGVHGGQLASEIHGKYFEVAKRASAFWAGTVIAGVALPVNAATVASKFTLYNPAGSGVDVELIEFTLGLTSATEVVNGIVMGVQTRVASGGGGAPGTLTAGVINNARCDGGNASKVNFYVAATLTNPAVLPVYPLGMNFDATSGAMSGINNYVFDGKIIIPPDCLVTFLTNVAAETAATCGLSWAEWPI
jgi:hypothetical protein